MRIKHNKTWYNNRIKEAECKLEELRLKIKQTIDASDFDSINKLYDKEYELEQSIKDLEHQRDTRNWTAGNWNSWELVTSNCD